MNTTNTPQALMACIDTECALVAEFIETLAAESQILETGQPDDLVASTTQKEQCAEKISQAAQQREKLLQELGYSGDNAGLQAASKNYPEISAAVGKLLDLALQARRQNETNGAAIAFLLRQNQQMIEALQRLAGASEVYDASGKSKTLDAPTTQPRLKPVKAG